MVENLVGYRYTYTIPSVLPGYLAGAEAVTLARLHLLNICLKIHANYMELDLI